MKLQIYSYVFYPESFLINELAFDLAAQGYDIEVSTSLPNYESKKIDQNYSLISGPYEETVNSVRIKRFPVIPRRKGLFSLTLNYLSNLLFGTLNAFRMRKGDIALTFGVSPIFLTLPSIVQKRLFKTPVVIWLQDPWPETFASVVSVSPRHLSYRILSRMVRWIYAQTDLILIQSEAYRAHLETHGYKGRVELIPNWAPTVENVSEDIPQWVAELPKDCFLLTFAGNVGRGQALDQLIEAARSLKKYPRLRVIIVGEGAELESLKKMVRSEGINSVVFCGRRPPNDMPALFEKSSCLYVSLNADSISSLTVPSKLQAYMRAGKPILASLQGEGARIIGNADCGFVSAPGQPQELKSNIEKLLSLPQSELDRLGSNAKLHYEQNFRKEFLLKKLDHLLREVVQ